MQRGRAVSRRCFASDGKALLMPAFGAYTGGLNVRDRAFLAVFGTRSFTAHMLGDRRLYAFAASRCLVGLVSSQSLRNTTLANQPVSSAIMAVARP